MPSNTTINRNMTQEQADKVLEEIAAALRQWFADAVGHKLSTSVTLRNGTRSVITDEGVEELQFTGERTLTIHVGALPTSALDRKLAEQGVETIEAALQRVTTRPVALNPEAWGDDDDAPRCYVKGCGAIDDLEPAGFPGQSLWVCPDCKASQQHQRELAGEFALEGAEG